MADLNLYRIHLRNGKCSGGHDERSTSYERQEREAGWKRCSCPIQASGTLSGKFLRVTTKQIDWDKARAWARPREIADSWDASVAGRLDRIEEQIAALAAQQKELMQALMKLIDALPPRE